MWCFSSPDRAVQDKFQRQVACRPVVKEMKCVDGGHRCETTHPAVVRKNNTRIALDRRLRKGEGETVS